MNLRKSCSFNLDANVVHEVDHLQDISYDDIEAAWYTDEDFLEMKNQQRDVITGKCATDEVKETRRGLECRVGESTKERRRRKDAILKSVLKKQAMLRKKNVNDMGVAIASVSREASRQCVQEARMIGMTDQAVIKRELAMMRHQFKCHQTGHIVTPPTPRRKFL